MTELDLKITKTAIQKIEKLTLNFETLKETFSRIEGSQKTKEKPQKWDALKIETSFKNLRMELDKLNQKFEESNHREIITKDENLETLKSKDEGGINENSEEKQQHKTNKQPIEDSSSIPNNDKMRSEANETNQRDNNDIQSQNVIKNLSSNKKDNENKQIDQSEPKTTKKHEIDEKRNAKKTKTPNEEKQNNTKVKQSQNPTDEMKDKKTVIPNKMTQNLVIVDSENSKSNEIIANEENQTKIANKNPKEKQIQKIKIDKNETFSEDILKRYFQI